MTQNKINLELVLSNFETDKGRARFLMLAYHPNYPTGYEQRVKEYSENAWAEEEHHSVSRLVFDTLVGTARAMLKVNTASAAKLAGKEKKRKRLLTQAIDLFEKADLFENAAMTAEEAGLNERAYDLWRKEMHRLEGDCLYGRAGDVAAKIGEQALAQFYQNLEKGVGPVRNERFAQIIALELDKRSRR